MSRPKIKQRTNYPHIMHGCILRDNQSPFPTHSHGLNEVGMPDFIFDPLAFGSTGNMNRINSAYDFFIKEKNRGLLNDILSGKTVKIKAGDLDKRLKSEPHIYCFRLVPATFEAVKQAYPDYGQDELSQMKFIQIWVDGDDYVLYDAYYKGGVKF